MDTKAKEIILNQVESYVSQMDEEIKLTTKQIVTTENTIEHKPNSTVYINWLDTLNARLKAYTYIRKMLIDAYENLETMI